MQMEVKFFGCSFTEGGGLDNIDYYNFVTNSNLYFSNDKTEEGGDYNKKIKNKLENFRNNHRFSNIVGDKLQIKCENFAISQNSNENIFKKLFSEIEKNKNEIYVVVLTIFFRVNWYYEKTKKEYNLNSFDNFNWSPYNNDDVMRDLFDTYKMYISCVFNRDIEKQKLITQIKLLDSFAKTKNSKILWASWETLFSENKNITNNHILFDNLDLGEYIIKNKYQIFNHSNNICNDNHICVPGNKKVADIIYEKVKETL